LILENDDLKLAEHADHTVSYDLPQCGGIIFQQQDARRRNADSVSG